MAENSRGGGRSQQQQGLAEARLIKNGGKTDQRLTPKLIVTMKTEITNGRGSGGRMP